MLSVSVLGYFMFPLCALHSVAETKRSSCDYIVGSGLCNSERSNSNEQKLIKNKLRGIGLFNFCAILTFKRSKPIYFKNKLSILRQTQAFCDKGSL